SPTVVVTWSAERERGEIWCPGVTALLLGDTMNRILADFRFTVSLQPRRNARPVVIVYCPESRHSEATQAPTARTCWKWPILRKAASLLSGNLTRTPGPDLLVGPFQGDFLSVSSYQCTFGYLQDITPVVPVE